MKSIHMKIANIHETLTGAWHITDNTFDHLDERGEGYNTERLAIKAARQSDYWTHRVTSTGKVVKL